MRFANQHPAILRSAVAGLFLGACLLFWYALPWSKEGPFSLGVWLGVVFFTFILRYILPISDAYRTGAIRWITVSGRVFPWVLLLTPSIQFGSFMSLPLPAGYLVLHWLSFGAYGEADHNGPIASLVLAISWIAVVTVAMLREKRMPNKPPQTTRAFGPRV